jgi:polysaccharide biosynthesis/export protein
MAPAISITVRSAEVTERQHGAPAAFRQTSFRAPFRRRAFSGGIAGTPRGGARFITASIPMKYFLILLLLTVAAAAQTQEKPWGMDKQKSAAPTTAFPTTKELPTSSQVVPMDGPVDPVLYIVGPNDVFTIGIFGPVTYAAPIPVSPEGMLLIPTVGEVPVAGASLRDAKDAVQRAIRKRYTTGDIAVTLTTPRPLLVTLRGAVLAPGQYVATAVDRVEKVLRTGATPVLPQASVAISAPPRTSSGTSELPDLPRMERAADLYEKASTRNILLIRRSRDTVRVDIPRYYATGDAAWNPYLQDGDLILVPQKNLEENFVTIHGAVNAPGVYEYAAGDRLGDILAIALGMLPGATVERVTVERQQADGTSREVALDPAGLNRGDAAAFPLQRGDRILIGSTAAQQGSFTVTVTGEVQRPGVYAIGRTHTRLSDAVRASGGRTDRALPAASVLLRRFDRLGAPATPQYELMRNWRSSQLNMVDSTYLVTLLREGMVPVNVDFDAAFRGDSTQDVELRAGDVLFLATDSRSVLVEGQVAHPGYQPYTPGRTVREYLAHAGGCSETADEGDVRVIKRGSREWMDPDDTVVESGDMIWVPKHIPHDATFYLSVFRDVATVTTALATTLLLIYQIQNTK